MVVVVVVVVMVVVVVDIEKGYKKGSTLNNKFLKFIQGPGDQI